MEPFRILPRVGPELYKTYEIATPTKKFTRPATCAEVDCPNREKGWKTVIDLSTELGRKQATYIRLHSGRSFTATQNVDVLTFTFYAGQDCFSEHRKSLMREPFFLIKGGDFRGNPLDTPTRRLRPQSWVDDMGESLESMKEMRERG